MPSSWLDFLAWSLQGDAYGSLLLGLGAVAFVAGLVFVAALAAGR